VLWLVSYSSLGREFHKRNQPQHTRHECSGSTRLPVQSTRPHHTSALVFALASWIMYKLAVLVYQCIHVYLADTLHSTACHWTSWSSTSAFIIDLGTDCTTDTALCDQRPSVSRRRSKNLENSLPSEVTSSSCLRSFKTKLKTHLFSASFTEMTVKWLKWYAFFTLSSNLNVM